MYDGSTNVTIKLINQSIQNVWRKKKTIGQRAAAAHQQSIKSNGSRAFCIYLLLVFDDIIHIHMYNHRWFFGGCARKRNFLTSMYVSH
jgi:hypothetical protein